MTDDEIREWAEQQAAKAPPLTAEQRARLAILLRPAPATTGTTARTPAIARAA